MIRLTRYFILPFLVTCLLSGVQSGPLLAQDEVLYVATDGNDQTGNGSQERPFATLDRAASQAEPGTTIYVTAGIYERQITISARGTADSPITIEPAPNATVRFDGQALAIPEDQNLVLIHDSAYLIFQGFEIANSTGRGLGVFESEHIIMRHNRVHHIQGRGIGGGGDYITIEENKVWLTSLENENEAFGAIGGWKAGISTYKRADDSASTNFIIRNNHIHDIWGEGIIALFVDGAQIEGNEVHDTYSVNIYVDNGRRVTIHGNYLYATTTRYNRNDRLYPAIGIHLANEAYSDVPNTQIDEILISNNLIVGAGRGISYWYDQRNLDPNNSYKNITIVHNVIINTHHDAIRFDSVGLAAVSPQNVLVQNNIIFAGGNGQALNIANPDVWTFSHNNWPNGMPDIAVEPHSFAAPPLFKNASGSLSPEDFQLEPESTSLGAGRPFLELPTDFWGMPRHEEMPSLGIYAPQVLDLPTPMPPTPAPTVVAAKTTPEVTSLPAPTQTLAPFPTELPGDPAATPQATTPSEQPALPITAILGFALLALVLIVVFVWVIYRSR